LFVDAAGRLLTCGQGNEEDNSPAIRFPVPTPLAALAGVWVRSVAAGGWHSLARSWDGRVYSWGDNTFGQLGHGDELDRSSPTLVEGLEGVRGVDATYSHSFAVTQSGDVFQCGEAFQHEIDDGLRPFKVEGFGGVRIRFICGGERGRAFGIGEAGEFFSWGRGAYSHLGHGDMQNQPLPKRVEALRGVRVISFSWGLRQGLALAEDGLVYTVKATSSDMALAAASGDLLPKPVEALRGVRIGSVAAGGHRSYAGADTGELWAWGGSRSGDTPLGRGELVNCPLPKPIESLRGIKLDAVAAGNFFRPWRGRTMDACLRGAARMQPGRVRSASALK
jgi:alpha-tubulin suppressor-like RCC1 family protein